MSTLFLAVAFFGTLALPPEGWTPHIPMPDPFVSEDDSGFEPPPPPRPADAVITAFLKRLESDGDYPVEARAFVNERAAAMEAADRRDFLNLAFSILDPKFKLALDFSDDDKPAEAAEAFESLSNADDPFLAAAAANLAATTLIELEDIERCQAMLARVRDAHRPIEAYTASADHFRFMEAYCLVHTLRYDQAVPALEAFLKHHPNAPERLRTAARQILTELSRRIPGRIGDVRDLLSYASRRIGHGATDEGVRRRQDQAVELLDRLIEEAEEQEKNCGGGEGEGGGQGGQNPGGENPSGGARRSVLPQGEGDVGQLRTTRAKPGEMWGKMPPRQREEILQTLQKQFPSQYRELLEQYYTQLAKDAPTP